MDDNSLYSRRDDKVYVSNIDYGCNHQDIKDLFQKVGKVAFVEMLKDKVGKPNGCAVVRFKDGNMIDKAMDAFNRYDYRGRNLVVKDFMDAPAHATMTTERPNRDRKRPREDDFGTIEPATKHGNTYGLSVKFLESLGIDGPLNNRVFVANLPYDAKEDDVKEVFTICGRVEDVELVKTDNGKSKGFGFVEFDHPIEAVQAISMLHNQPYHDRKLSVQYTNRNKRSGSVGSKLPAGLLAIGMGLGVNGAALKDVARTIEAGQQQSLMGAVPLNSCITPMNINMGLSPNMNRNFPSLVSDMPGSTTHLMASSLDKLLGGSSLMNAPAHTPFGNGRSMRDSPSVSLGSSLMSQNCIQVSNLPQDYTWKALCDLCQSFGEVSFAKITSRGIGVVHFESNTAARRAIDMLDHQEFEGRYLEAKFM